MDKTIRIWDTILGQTLRILSSHTEAVSALRWGGTGLIYSGSRDKTIKVWRSVDVCNKNDMHIFYYFFCICYLIMKSTKCFGVFKGVFCRNLEGHGHWVNCLALNTDYVMRTGDFEPADAEKLAYNDIKRSGEFQCSFFTNMNISDMCSWK